jgi:uncharacterized protein (TIRG00374 family)
MLNRILLFFASLFIGIGLFIWIINFVGWHEIENAFLIFRGWQGLIVFILTFLIMAAANWRWKEILKGEGVEVSFWKLFRPYLAGFAVMFLAPILLWAGEIFRSYSVKEGVKISRAKAIASVIIDRILEWTINLIVILFSILFFFYKIGSPPKNLAIIFGFVFFIFFGGIFVFYFKTFKRESIAKTFGRIFYNRLDKEPLDTEKEIFNFFKLQNRAMWKSFGISFIRAGLMYVRVWVLIFFLVKPICILPVLSILGFTYLAAMIPIPTALGSHEAIQTFSFDALGLGISSATAFTMIIRAAEIIFALVGLVIFLRQAMTFFKNFLFKRIDRLINKRDDLS